MVGLLPIIPLILEEGYWITHLGNLTSKIPNFGILGEIRF